MRKATFVLVLLTLILKSYSQCVSYGYPFFDEPDELYRGRLKFAGELYGNPYTLMDRTKFKNNPADGFDKIKGFIFG